MTANAAPMVKASDHRRGMRANCVAARGAHVEPKPVVADKIMILAVLSPVWLATNAVEPICWRHLDIVAQICVIKRDIAHKKRVSNTH